MPHVIQAQLQIETSNNIVFFIFIEHEIIIVRCVAFVDAIVNILIWAIFYKLLIAKERDIEITFMETQCHTLHHKVLLGVVEMWMP